MKLLKNFFLLTIIVLLAFGLRLVNLNSSFWYEETHQVILAQRYFVQADAHLTLFQPPIFSVLTKLALEITSSELALRFLLALIPSIISIVLLFKISQKLFSDKVATIASLLLATSSLDVFYSQEVGPYALTTALSLLSWWVLINFDQAKVIKKKILGKKLELNRKYLWLTLVSIVGLFTHYVYLAVIVAQFLYILFQKREQLNQVIFSFSLSALIFLPQISNLLKQFNYISLNPPFRPYFDPSSHLSNLEKLLFIIGRFTFGILNLNLTFMIILVSILLLSILLFVYKDVDKKSLADYIGSLGFVKAKDDKHKVEALTTVTIAVLIPMLLIWIFSFWLDLFKPKHILMVLPFFFLLISSSLFYAKRKIFAYLVIGLVLAVNFYSLSQYFFRTELQRENWRDLSSSLTRFYPAENSVVIFSSEKTFFPWQWYGDQSYKVLTTGTDLIKPDTNLKEKLKQLNESQFVLVFDYGRHLSDAENKVISEVESYGYQQIDVINQPGIGFIRVFAKSDSLISNL